MFWMRMKHETVHYSCSYIVYIIFVTSCTQPNLFSRSMLGAVVIGIGTAGCVRIRDMLVPLRGSPAEKLAVKGFISR